MPRYEDENPHWYYGNQKILVYGKSSYQDQYRQINGTENRRKLRMAQLIVRELIRHRWVMRRSPRIAMRSVNEDLQYKPRVEEEFCSSSVSDSQNEPATPVFDRPVVSVEL
ncbi:hypothetical protein L484_021525 [Morus notabilis]|uniref:Uncharacterized protein n=1 Tax=Morus notabilis TaxID=981085 RepID=W9S384_9ROSA|nr:hypothetical protein L484_021525 [Morus notabilis]